MRPSPPARNVTKVQNQTLTMESTQQGSQDQKDDHEKHPQPKTVPVPGGRKRVNILMKPTTPSSTLSTTVILVVGCCPHSWGGAHTATTLASVWPPLTHRPRAFGRGACQIVPLVRSAPLASLRGGFSVDWATGIITRGISGSSGILNCYDPWKVEKRLWR